MCARPVLSPEERDLVLREARKETGGTRIPIRTFGVSGSPTPPRTGGVTPPPGPPEDRPAIALPPKRRRRRRALLTILAIVLILVGLGTAKVVSVGQAVLSPDRSIIAQLADVLFRRGTLAGERDNRVNVLLVAIGGEGHQGENLADTVILASLRPQEKDVALFSIPRDLYVRIPDTELFTRINAVHAYGEQQRRGGGLALLKKTVTDVTGQPVHYVARVDFKAFKLIVDEVGGIDITIKNGFYDYWHKISFPAGTEHMNGERALAYVRARFIEGSEGGDFKRAERTQQVLLAIRKKILSVQTAVDIRALAGILDALRDNVATSFTLGEIKRMADLTRDIPDNRIYSTVLTTGPNGLLVGTTEILGGRPAAVLRPRAGLNQYGEIHVLASNIFSEARTAPPPATPEQVPPPTAPSPSPTPATVAAEQPTVEIRNGTNIIGLAARAAKTLEKQEFTITSVGNAGIRNRTQTIVVDRTEGGKPASLQRILDTLGAARTVQFPEAEKQPGDVNFIIFLGTDVAEKFKP